MLEAPLELLTYASPFPSGVHRKRLSGVKLIPLNGRVESGKANRFTIERNVRS
jgi:hypothetical protein